MDTGDIKEDGGRLVESDDSSSGSMLVQDCNMDFYW